jgi:hypothetical protein
VIAVPREPFSVRTLTWVGTGIALLALAFTVHPVAAPSWTFWLVVGMGAAAAGVGCTPLSVAVLRRLTRSPRDTATSTHRAHVGTECWRVWLALGAFIEERDRQRPRGMFGAGAERVDRWAEETAARYRSELRQWVRLVYAEALAFGAVSESARLLVEAPSAAQLGALRDVFHDAAERLERPDETE